jgi:hypothetical protein
MIQALADRGGRVGASSNNSRAFALAVAVAMHAHPGFDERPRQPGPDGALVIGAIPLQRRAAVVRRHNPFRPAPASAAPSASKGDPRPPARRARPVRPRSRRAAGRPRQRAGSGAPGRRPARLMIDIDDIIKAAARLVPETLLKSGAPCFKRARHFGLRPGQGRAR